MSRNKRELVAVTSQEIPLKLEINYKAGMYVSFNFDWYSVLLDTVF